MQVCVSFDLPIEKRNDQRSYALHATEFEIHALHVYVSRVELFLECYAVRVSSHMVATWMRRRGDKDSERKHGKSQVGDFLVVNWESGLLQPSAFPQSVTADMEGTLWHGRTAIHVDEITAASVGKGTGPEKI